MLWVLLHLDREDPAEIPEAQAAFESWNMGPSAAAASTGPAVADLTPYADPVPQVAQDPWRDMMPNSWVPVMTGDSSSSGTDPEMPGLGPGLIPHLAPLANPGMPDDSSPDDSSSNPWTDDAQGSGPSTARGGPETDDDEPTVAEAATAQARAAFAALVNEQEANRLRALNLELTAQGFVQSKAMAAPPPRRAAPPTRPAEVIGAGKPTPTKAMPTKALAKSIETYQRRNPPLPSTAPELRGPPPPLTDEQRNQNRQNFRAARETARTQRNAEQTDTILRIAREAARSKYQHHVREMNERVPLPPGPHIPREAPPPQNADGSVTPKGPPPLVRAKELGLPSSSSDMGTGPMEHRQFVSSGAASSSAAAAADEPQSFQEADAHELKKQKWEMIDHGSTPKDVVSETPHI